MTISYDKQVLIKRGNTASAGTYIGPLGELVLNTDTNQVFVHNGTTVGGITVGDRAAIAALIANAAAQSAQIGQLQTDITTANTSMKGYVDNSISSNIAAIIGGAPGALDTLNELANALGNNASFSTTITNSLASLTSNVAIQAGQIAAIGANVGTGGITFADTTISAANDENINIQAKDDDGVVTASIGLDPDDGQIRIIGKSSEDDDYFDNSDWGTAVWTNTTLSFTNAPNIIAVFASSYFNITGISVNDGDKIQYDGAASGGGDIGISITESADPNPTTINNIRIYYRYESRIEIDNDDEELNIIARNLDISIETNEDIDMSAVKDINIDAGDYFDLRNLSGTRPIRIITDRDNTSRTWAFGANGSLTFPDNTVQTTAWTGTVNYANVTNTPTLANVATSGDYSDLINIPVDYANVNVAAYLTTNNYATENYVDNSLANISLPSTYSNGNVVSLLSAFGSNSITTTGNITGGNLSATGNITAQNFIGNITITGNVIGTSANVDLVAGANTWSFDNTGNLTFPNSTVQSTAYVAADNAVKVGGSWTVTAGTADYSFTVPVNGVYQLWVRGNIPNGIITYTATVSVTNSNVPVLGQQFAWNYVGGGGPILITAIPSQIIGTAGIISNAAPSVGSTSNTFVFGINNTSGGNVTVDYGYTTIS